MSIESMWNGVAAVGQSVASVAKVMLRSRWNVSMQIKADKSDKLVILGNGPSLNITVNESADFLASCKLLAVNFAANTDLFFSLRPEYYVLADPHFFNADAHINVKKLRDNLNSVDWSMTLFVPANVAVKNIGISNSNITIVRYNLTPVEGLNCLENVMFGHGLGMPRPRNVLIPSLMLALHMGFKSIYVAGADHSWSKSLSVDDENHVISVQPHFYTENEKEVKRINTEYMNHPLHTIMYSFYVAFKSYFTIERYARHIGADIWNITPGSFIDAFRRKKV